MTKSLKAITVVLLTSFSTSIYAAEEIRAGGVLLGSDLPPGFLFNQGVASGILSFSRSGNWASTSGSATFGRVQIDLTAAGSQSPSRAGYATSGGSWTDTVIVTPDNPALLGAPATFAQTFHLTGSEAASQLAISTGEVRYDVFGEGGTLYEGQFRSDGFYGTPIGNLSSFVWARSVTLGSPLSFETHLSGIVNVGTGGITPSGSLHGILSAGTVSVLDTSGQPISFSLTSSVGSARARNFTSGGNFAGFGLTNSTGLHSGFSLLAGAAGTATTNVAAAFIPNPGTNALLASDAVDLNGTQTNKFALSVSFDLAAISQAASSLEMLLVYFDPTSKNWIGAASGNSDGGAGGQSFVGAYNSLVHTNLGDHGVDITNHTAWAVLDHNSVFAVGKLIVPPVLHWTGIVLATNGLALALSGAPGSICAIEYSGSVNSTNWLPLGSVTLNTNGFALFVDTNSVTQQKFFRAHL